MRFKIESVTLSVIFGFTHSRFRGFGSLGEGSGENRLKRI